MESKFINHHNITEGLSTTFDYFATVRDTDLAVLGNPPWALGL
jgi:hypothetical protein